MPLRMKVTPITLYNEDDSVFDGLIENLPVLEFERSEYYEDLFLTGWEIDSETLINNILLETGELDVIYTNPDFFKFALGTWAAKNKAVWQSLYETLFYRYNPIWNKDGTLKENATETRNLLNGLTVSKTTKNDRIISEDETITDEDDTLETLNLTDETDREETPEYNEKIERTETPNLTDTTSGTLTKNNSLHDITANDTTKTNTGTQTDIKTDTTEEKVAAFNETTYTNRNQTTTTINDTRTDNLTETTDNDIDYTRSEMGTDTNSETVQHTGTSDIVETKTHRESNIIDETAEHTGTDRTERDYSRTRNTDSTIGDTGTETITNSGTDSGTVGNIGTRTEQGNIGVTMTQALIEEERKIVQFNIYDRIIDDFKARFCILIY